MKGITGAVAVLGIDLAKRVFALHGIDVSGRKWPPIVKASGAKAD
jgi:hypothetical protein